MRGSPIIACFPDPASREPFARPTWQSGPGRPGMQFERRNRPGLLGWVGGAQRPDARRTGGLMSDLASAVHLRRAASQLPVRWYCDPDVFAAEQRLLFANAPGYVGHELMVPNPGDFHALEWRDNAQVLVRNGTGVELLSNVCRHRQA